MYEGTEQVFAESWEKLVCQHIAVARAREVFPACFWSSTSPEDLAAAGVTDPAEVLTAFAAEHALTPAWFGDERHVWFGDERHVCLAGPGTLSWAGLTHAVFMVVAGDDEALVRRLGDRLVATFRARNLTRMN